MKTTKHTPGPWIGGHAIQGSNGNPICRITSDAEWKSKTDQVKYGCQGFSKSTPVIEADANAALIAAAPDLLEACDYVVKWHREHDSGEGELFGLDFVTTCIAAIRKATGE